MGDDHVLRADLVASLTDDVRRHVLGTERGALALVGAVGLGKSTLLGAVTRGLPDVRIQSAIANELDCDRPYAIAGRLLRRDHNSAQDRTVLERAVEDLDELCSAGPLVLAVDDAHLADGESLSLLHRISVESDGFPVAVVLAYRPMPERAALTMFAAQPHVRTVVLSPVSDDDVTELIRRRLDAAPSPDLRRLLGRAGGNPLHVTQLLDALVRDSLVAIDPAGGTAELCGDDTELVGEVESSVRAYLRGLPPRVRDLVQVLAVADGPVTVGELADIGGRAPAQCPPVIASAVDAGVVRWLDDDHIDLVTPVYREVAYRDVPPGLRRLLHSAVADALSRGGADLGRIETHRERSVESGEFVRSRQPSSMQAFGVFDADELAAIAAEDSTLARAVVLAESGRFADAADLTDRVLAGTGPSDGGAEDTARRAVAFTVQLAAATLTADIARADTSIQGLLAIPLPPDTRSWLERYRHWLVLVGGSGPVPAGVPAAPPVDEPLNDFGLDTIVPGIHAVLRGDCLGGLEMFERGQRAAGGPGLLARESAAAGLWAMWAALHAHGPIAAHARRTPVARDGRTPVEMWLLPVRHSVAAAVLFFLGRWDECVAACDDAAAVAVRTDSGWTSMAVALAALAEVYRGDLESADRRLAGHDPAGTRLFGFPDVEYAHAELAAAQGRLGAAVDHAAGAWTVAVDGGRSVWALRFGPHVARLAMQAGDTELFAAVHTALQEISTAGCPALSPAVELVEAMGKSDPVALARVADAFAARGDGVGELAALEEAAVAAASADDRESVRAYARRAHDLAVHVGASTVTQRLSGRVRESGVALGVLGRRRSGGVGWESLTDAERRVALLVGKGLSGPQIAARLGVSPRTVQTHVSHALAKLGLQSRVGLARVVLGHDQGR